MWWRGCKCVMVCSGSSSVVSCVLVCCLFYWCVLCVCVTYGVGGGVLCGCGAVVCCVVMVWWCVVCLWRGGCGWVLLLVGVVQVVVPPRAVQRSAAAYMKERVV